MQDPKPKPKAAKVILAFAIVYIVWGSTYFFIKKALDGFPPFMLGGIRFLTAAFIMMGWCVFQKENLFRWKQVKNAAFSGILLLLIGNGLVMWVEQSLPSAVVAIMISTAPLWFLLLDKPKWAENFRTPSTVVGLILGFIGIVLLFYKGLMNMNGDTTGEAVGLLLVTLAAISWSAGSLYSKYYSSETPAAVNTMWQMFAAAIGFIILSAASGEPADFQLAAVTADAWYSLLF